MPPWLPASSSSRSRARRDHLSREYRESGQVLRRSHPLAQQRPKSRRNLAPMAVWERLPTGTEICTGRASRHSGRTASMPRQREISTAPRPDRADFCIRARPLRFRMAPATPFSGRSTDRDDSVATAAHELPRFVCVRCHQSVASPLYSAQAPNGRTPRERQPNSRRPHRQRKVYIGTQGASSHTACCRCVAVAASPL